MKKIFKKFLFVTGKYSALIGLIMIPLPLPIPGILVLAVVSLPCFIYSSDEHRDWLLNHRWCGKTLSNWYYHRTVDRKTKRNSLFLTIGGFIVGLVTLKFFPSTLFWFLIGSIISGALTAYMVTRPSPSKVAAESKA